MRILAGVLLIFGLSYGLAMAQQGRQVTPVLPRMAPICNDLNDCDGDGHRSRARGGDDCNDHDRNAFPGNPEVGDSRGHDEDCDPSTFGGLDRDADGYISAQYFNADANGRHTSGGTDCDDDHGYIHPNAQELPNHLDDDCNGAIDDLAGIWWTPPPGWAPRDGIPPAGR